MAVQFFYDNQIRRFLLQFTRLVSNFQVQFGSKDPNTNVLALQTVPVYYGDSSRQAAMILKNNSENSMQAVPAMAFYISGLQYDRGRIQEPNFISAIHLRERMYDPVTGMQNNLQGDTYTVERLMPVPYLMTIKLDIWTSNTEQKLQIIEQIATLFNPSLEIQSTDNYIDWTSLSVVLLTDMTWSSRSIPVGTDDNVDVATMTFEIPIWISPPAKVTQMGVIQKIIAQVYDSAGELANDIFDPNKILIRQTVTFMDYGVLLVGNRLTLVRKNQDIKSNSIDTQEIELYSPTKNIWRTTINAYGTLINGTSQIRLETESGGEIVGTVAYDPTDDTQLLLSIIGDTLPSNSLDPIDGVIDPYKSSVIGLLYNNLNQYQVAVGTRYLILNNINHIDNTDFAKAWNPHGIPLVAHANDIIQYDGTRWTVVFDSQNHLRLEYLTNLATNVQLRWNGHEWAKSYEGLYRENSWRLVL